MSWQGFLDEQSAVASPAQIAMYGATIAGAPTGAYLEAHAHGPLDYPLPAGAPISGAVAAPAAAVNPVETAFAAYGKVFPLSVLGKARIGGLITVGPWIVNGLASFGISFGFPADPTGTRTLLEIAFDSEVVWDSVNGFRTEAFTYRFYQGTYTQAADAIETAYFGANAVAYRPQMMLFFENLPIANTKFKKIPYVAAVIQDGTGPDVNLGEAFERLAYSPFVEYTSSQFETTGVTDGLVNGGLLIAQDAEFLATIQQFGRFYPKWDILQTDKLRIVDRGATVTADITLDKTRLMNKIIISRQGPDTVARELELSTIDPDADYTIVPSVAQRPRVPISVTTSVTKDTAFLPVVMDSPTRLSIVTYAKYHEEQARKTISGTAMMYGSQIEPGALVAMTDLGPDFQNEVFKVRETLHGVNYAVEFTAESILKCGTSSSSSSSAPAFVNAGIVSLNTSVHTGALPTSRTNGNLLILYFRVISTIDDPTVSAGWTAIDTFGFGGSTYRHGAYYAYVTGSETAPTITWAGGGGAISVIAQYSGVAASAATVAGTKNGSQTGTSITTSAITSSRDTSLAISATWNSSALASSLPSGFNNEGVGIYQNAFSSLRLADVEIPSSGSISGVVNSTQLLSAPWGTFLFELKSPP
jgi:hypothetical protein